MALAHELFRLVPCVNFSNNQFVSMEYFKGQQLEDAVSCLQKFIRLTGMGKDNIVDTPCVECCAIHPQMKLDLYCKQCGVDVCKECTASSHRTHEHTSTSDKIYEETRRLGKSTENVVELMEEMKRAISGVKEMKQKVKKRKDNNISMTREVFAILRKAIDEREEQTIGEVKEAAYKRERALELQLERLVLLWTQLKNCLEVMKKTNEEKMRAEELAKRRMILEQRSDHLKEMKKRSRLEPVMSEQKEAQFVNIEQLCEAVNNLGYFLVDPCKCKVVIPSVIVKRTAKLIIMLKNRSNTPVSDCSSKLNVVIENAEDGKILQVRAIKEVDNGRYEASFTASRCGYYMISIIVDGHHIPGSPYKTPVDRDYKMVEQNGNKVVTDYEGNKFGYLSCVAIGPDGQVVIADYGNHCAVLLDDKLSLLKVIGQGSGNSRLVNPIGVAVTDNVIAVSDEWSNQVKKYSLQGELVSTIGCYGNETSQFMSPMGLAFNNNKLLYVVDNDNHRVQVFKPDDTFAFSFGNKGNKWSGPGYFCSIFSIAIDPNNNALVTDYDGGFIHIFDESGRFIQAIKCLWPDSIAISPTGYLITSHYGDTNQIRVWSPTYSLIKQFGKKGPKEGEFNRPTISMDSSGSIYIAEWDNKRLQVLNS